MPKGHKRSDARALLDAVRAHPGSLQRELARRVGRNERLVRGHLRQLVLDRKIRVVSTRAGRRTYHALPVGEPPNA